jgi:hypothetical protein
MPQNPEAAALNKLIAQLHSIQEEFPHESGQPVTTVSVQVSSPLTSWFVDTTRIAELHAIKSQDFDLSKLLRYCEELNTSFRSNCFLAVPMLGRAILDHVPPIFVCKSFAEVANNYAGGTKSFKQSMQNLENSLRNIADAHLHVQIRKSESLPNVTQVNFSADLDVLLAEIVRLLKQKNL